MLAVYRSENSEYSDSKFLSYINFNCSFLKINSFLRMFLSRNIVEHIALWNFNSKDATTVQLLITVWGDEKFYYCS